MLSKPTICRSKGVTAVILAFWVVFSLFYYNILYLVSYYKIDIVKAKPIAWKDEGERFVKEYNEQFNESENFLLNTPGCTIPKYDRKPLYLPIKAYKSTCEKRGVFIEAISDDEIAFTINEDIINSYRKDRRPYSCCYEFVSRPRAHVPRINDTHVNYSECVVFENRTKIKLKTEVISVKCHSKVHENAYDFYTDAYIMVKKVQKIPIKEHDEKWNVLILGMDTMSRARSRHSLPLTMKFFQKNGWLDYKAYNKVGENTYPNIMAILSGDAKLYCNNPSMDSCKDLLIWTKYKSAGYVTAYGEDNLKLPDTFRNYGGFEIPPTDHYMRPFFLLGEYVSGNRVCSRRMPSAVHILDYARQLTKAYKHDGFFGLFWINSYSHNENNDPKLLDEYLSTFLTKISSKDTRNNTFIFFLSDHGMRFGKMRLSVESFYEERLPMLYVWVPHKFRMQYPNEYYNLQVNQNRLVTTYDVHATLWDILKKSNDTVTVIKSKKCPQCTSLFHEKYENRTCSEAAIEEKWCSCHQLKAVNKKTPEAQSVVSTALFALRKYTKYIKTEHCTKCAQMSLKTVLRVHSYDDTVKNTTHYVVAFLTSPGDSGYEATVDKEISGYKVNGPVTSITAYNKKGVCVINRLAHQGYCMCKNIPKCDKRKKIVDNLWR